MKIKLLFILLFIAFFLKEAKAQFHDNIWFVGQDNSQFYGKYKLDFNEFPMMPKNHDVSMNFHSCSASYADRKGNLICYTNGISIWNKNHKIMEGGKIINPGEVREDFLEDGFGLDKAAFFLPKPNNDSLVYLIHRGGDYLPDSLSADEGPRVIYYSIINVKSNLGSGKVIEVNQPLILGHFEQVTANRHANGRDWWIVVSDLEEGIFYKHLLTPTGFIGPFSQPIDLPKTRVRLSNFSPDGTKYVSYTGYTGFSLYDFDRCSGEFSNEFILDFPPMDTTGWFYDAAFSPNNRYLYISLLWATQKFGSGNYNFSNPLLIQYDLNSNDIASSADTVGLKDSLPNPPLSWQWNGVTFNGLQLAPNGKIYSFSLNSKIHTIQEPNRKGKACRMMKRFPPVDRGISSTTPYYPNYRLGPIDGSPCDTLGINNNPIANYRYENWDTLDPLRTEFADLSYYEPAEWFWEFENLDTSRDTNPEFTFPAPGIYEVCLTVSNVNSSNRTCKNVPVGQVSDVEEAWEKGEPVVFPNPTSNAFQVYLPEQKQLNIQLFNVSGQQVFTKQTIASGEQVDVSFLSEGIYFYSFLDDKNEVVKSGKLIIVR